MTNPATFFRGFFIQARLVADGSNVGEFLSPQAGEEYRLSSCVPSSVSLWCVIGLDCKSNMAVFTILFWFLSWAPITQAQISRSRFNSDPNLDRNTCVNRAIDFGCRVRTQFKVPFREPINFYIMCVIFVYLFQFWHYGTTVMCSKIFFLIFPSPAKISKNVDVQYRLLDTYAPTKIFRKRDQIAKKEGLSLEKRDTLSAELIIIHSILHTKWHA